MEEIWLSSYRSPRRGRGGTPRQTARHVPPKRRMRGSARADVVEICHLASIVSPNGVCNESLTEGVAAPTFITGPRAYDQSHRSIRRAARSDHMLGIDAFPSTMVSCGTTWFLISSRFCVRAIFHADRGGVACQQRRTHGFAVYQLENKDNMVLPAGNQSHKASPTFMYRCQAYATGSSSSWGEKAFTECCMS